MALSRIRCSRDLPSVLSRFNHPANVSPLESNHIRQGSEIGKFVKSNAKAGFHVSGVRRYPEIPRLPLPSNVSEIFGNETGRFTPERARDIAAPVLFYVTGQGNRDFQSKSNYNGNSTNWGSARASFGDNHVDSYDCFGAVSLNSSMQSNVPSPFCSSGKASHFNMPGGQWAKDGKYIAEDMQKSHYTSVKARELKRKRRSNGPLTNAVLTRLTPLHECHVEFSTDSKTTVKDSENNEPKVDSKNTTGAASVALTNAEKLKKAVKDYGSTVIVFHIGISLISLGVCYIAVSSGLDVGYFVKTISNGASERFENVMANSSTFLVAYAVHKLLAPVRISITLGATPFVVRYLRNVGILKMPKA